ncbi:malonate decarboxylase holo-ACP synthase [Pendulispora rubella]|uniref:Malonate decarboxylase holo-ACP synthase n=1 Tax=Pendulispora rubella TaxID=2741070 RepID=A0ABZ2LGG1_9BACT
MERVATVHDLLRIEGDLGGEVPAWVAASLRRAPWVVVRRGASPPSHIAVGIRGTSRDQRFAAFVPAERVLERITPEHLAACRTWRTSHRLGRVPALSTLEAIAPVLDDTGLRWGPAGSVGFELASGVDTAREGSDLDLVVRAQVPIPRSQARALVAYLARQPVAVDVRIETPAGAIALLELASSTASLLLRTSTEGARLVADPWQAP